MPQVDLETLVSVCGGGGDRKIACETLADDALPWDPDVPDSAVVDVPPDFPPESFWLSKDAEFDWFDRNAFFERKESTKGNNNSTNLNPNVNPSHSNSSSQRFGMKKSKAAIIGLPKTQKTTFVDSKRRNCKPPNIRLFPKRLDSVGKAPAVSVTEPSSPKVSCIGRVRSKRCRSRRKSSAQAAAEQEKPASQTRTGKGQKTGLISKLTSLFRSEGHRRRKSNKSSVQDRVNERSEDSSPRRSNVTVKPVNTEPAAPADPPALGGMTRFASGRRSDSWVGAEDCDVSGHNSLDFGRRGV